MKKKAAEDQNLLTTAETARRLGLEPRTLEGWRSRGVGPTFVRLPKSRTVRYRPCDVDVWVERGLRSSTSDPGPEGLYA